MEWRTYISAVMGDTAAAASGCNLTSSFFNCLCMRCICVYMYDVQVYHFDSSKTTRAKKKLFRTRLKLNHTYMMVVRKTSSFHCIMTFATHINIERNRVKNNNNIALPFFLFELILSILLICYFRIDLLSND